MEPPNCCNRQRNTIHCSRVHHISSTKRCQVPQTLRSIPSGNQWASRAIRSALHPANLQANLNEFLLQYRKVPHSETGEAPAKLSLGRNIRSRLDLVRPQSVQTRTAEKQRVAFEPSYRTFLPGQLVYCLSGSSRMDKWIRGTVVSRLGDLHYSINCNGNQMKRHVDQMRPALDDNRTE